MFCLHHLGTSLTQETMTPLNLSWAHSAPLSCPWCTVTQQVLSGMRWGCDAKIHTRKKEHSTDTWYHAGDNAVLRRTCKQLHNPPTLAALLLSGTYIKSGLIRPGLVQQGSESPAARHIRLFPSSHPQTWPPHSALPTECLRSHPQAPQWLFQAGPRQSGPEVCHDFGLSDTASSLSLIAPDCSFTVYDENIGFINAFLISKLNLQGNMSCILMTFALNLCQIALYIVNVSSTEFSNDP